MCGIAGYVDFGACRPDRAVLEAMAFSLRRRGPDESGVLVHGPCGLAHSRLIVIDLASSHQPMEVADSPVCVVYNGELYNYVQLRDQLRSTGVSFESSGDTEVLLRWLDREWAAAMARFSGMFAFAAWHQERRQLLLARDPLGIKPLYYSVPAPGLIVFGSEIKALLEHPAVDAELDLSALRQALRFRAVYGERSLYRGIRQLPPGHFLEFDATGMRIGRHFDLNLEISHESELIQNLSEREIILRGEQLLEAAVDERLVADVPVGAFLSGGLDSSLIVALIRSLRAPDEDICTFSVGFHNDRQSELPFARMVAAAMKTRHTEISVSQTDYISMFSAMTACRDAPISEPQDLAIARMSEVARQEVKVVLSGEGTDEAFGGYPKYRFANPPWLLGLALRTCGPARVAGLAGVLGLDRRRALVAARALSLPREIDRIVQWFSHLDRQSWHSLLPELGWSDEQWAATRREQLEALHYAASESHLGRMQLVDCLTWLPGNLLERGDRMTMSAGLEMRVPFVDKRLVPFGLALKDRMKVRGASGKWIVRRWASHRLPRLIINRRKCGFHIPLAEWFRGKMRPMLFSYLTADRGLCGTYGDRREVLALLEAHDKGNSDVSLALWALLAAEVWYQDVFLAHRARNTAMVGPNR